MPTSFKWSFNNTAETIDMPQTELEEYNKSSSRLTYTPTKVIFITTIYKLANGSHMIMKKTYKNKVEIVSIEN